MADNLQRVGLVFKADGTVDFNKSLKEITASIQENRSAFNLVKSTWDESTKTAEKLKETQKYLAEQTKDYSDKVTILSRQLDELESAENRDEKAIQNKRNQLNQAKTSLKQYIDETTPDDFFALQAFLSDSTLWGEKVEGVEDSKVEIRATNFFDICGIADSELAFSNALAYFMRKYPSLVVEFIRKKNPALVSA